MTALPLLGGALHWHNDTTRPSEDAFWLAACVPDLAPHTPVLDIGCGSGAVGLALLTRQPTLVLTALDCDANILHEATQNAGLNQRAITTLHHDILQKPLPTQWRVVVCNPPFHARAAGHSSPSARKTLAHGVDDIGAWVNAWHASLSGNGTLYAIVHATLLDDITAACMPFGGHFCTALVATHATRAPKRALLRWHKNGLAFTAHTAPMVPSYHSPLRQAVLHKAKALDAFRIP